MRDLEEIDVRQALGQQGRVDAFLDVAHEQDPTSADLAEEHDRDVVDPGPAIRWRGRHLAADRPQDVEVNVVDGEPVTRRETETHGCSRSGELAQPRGIARSRSAHPGFEDACHTVSLEQEREAGDVVLVRMAQHHGIDAPVPRRHPLVELDEKPIRVRSAVDEQATAARTLDQD